MYLKKVNLSKSNLCIEDHVQALSACLQGIDINSGQAGNVAWRPDWGSPIVTQRTRSRTMSAPPTPIADPFVVNEDDSEEDSKDHIEEANQSCEYADMKDEFEKLQQLVIEGRMSMEEYTNIICQSMIQVEPPPPPPPAAAANADFVVELADPEEELSAEELSGEEGVGSEKGLLAEEDLLSRPPPSIPPPPSHIPSRLASAHSGGWRADGGTEGRDPMVNRAAAVGGAAVRAGAAAVRAGAAAVGAKAAAIGSKIAFEEPRDERGHMAVHMGHDEEEVEGISFEF
jgi:hypothetical protein